MTVTSPDINVFDVKTLYDLSGANPVVKLYNLSSGPHLNNMSYWFVLKSPSGVVYHLGVEGAPDRTGVWNTEYIVPDNIPQIQGHIDWSGSNYEIVAYAKDSANNVFQTPPYLTRICRPAGNIQGNRTNFGAGSLSVMMNCCTGKLLVEDVSNYGYNGLTGTRISKKLKLVFPPDDTDTTPAPFEVNDNNTTLIPITYNGKNYQILLDAVYEYEYGNNTFVRLKYKFKACFEVNCGTDLCVVLCALSAFENTLTENGCTADQREKLLLIVSKLTRALAGIMQPLCGINVPKLVAEIREMLGSCTDCESNGGGINPANNCAIPVDLQIETSNPPED